MDNFEFSKAFDFVWERVQDINRDIDKEKPWMMAKNGETEKLDECLKRLINNLLDVNYMLSPFLPDTAEKIYETFAGKIKVPKTPLFPKN